MQALAPYGIYITTFESSGKPTLTHVFWSDTLDGAFGVAKSHLITDFYFSSSFEGTMPWKGSTLELYNDGFIVGPKKFNTIEEFDRIYLELNKDAINYNDQKYQNGTVDGILDIQ